MDSIDQTLAVATAHHRAGRIDEAERLYREVLAQAPGQPDALHLLGVLALQSGRPEQAVDLIGQAIAGDDGEAMFHANLGHALHAVGRTRDAGIAFGHALALLCNSGESWGNIGALAGLIRRYDHETRRAAGAEVDRHYALGDVMRRLSLLFHLTGDLVHYETLVREVLADPERFTMPSLHYGYWGMAMQLFQGQALSGDVGAFGAGPLRRFHRLVVAQTAARYHLASRLQPAARRDGIRRIALITNQMLSTSHQPTMDAFDYARRLQDDHGCEVVIINPNAMAATPENGFVPEYSYNVEDSYQGEQNIGIGGGTRVRMASFPERRFDAEKAAAIVDYVNGFDPDVILAFGGANVVADLFASSRPVVCLPTSSGLPPTAARLILGYDEADTADGWPDDAQAAFRPYSFGWSPPDAGPERSRFDFLLPSSGPLFLVVGNRLDHELDDRFLDLVDRLLDRLPDARVAFAGAVETLPARLSRLRNAGRAVRLGHVEPIRPLYRLATAYLNPVRQGGGGSAAFALVDGLPVVTLPAGDVAAVVGPGFVVADADAAIERCVALATDPALRAQAAADARARFAASADRSRSVERLLAYCREAQALG